jgi:thiamine monophosphate synthase
MSHQLALRRIAISPPALQPAGFNVWAGHAVRIGASALMLRPVGWSADAVEATVLHYHALFAPNSVPLLLNWQPIVMEWPVSGWHLKHDGDWSAVPSERSYWVGQSCHNLESALRAEQAGADYIFLSPIFPTASHVGVSGLGLAVLADIAQAIRVPIFALGGINHANEQDCLAAGAYGVAAISWFENPKLPR